MLHGKFPEIRNLGPTNIPNSGKISTWIPDTSGDPKSRIYVAVLHGNAGSQWQRHWKQEHQHQSHILCSVVPQYAGQNLRHCVQYTQHAAVPQYTAASYTMLLKLGVVSIEPFLCGHSNSSKQKFSHNFFFPLYFRRKHYKSAMAPSARRFDLGSDRPHFDSEASDLR